MKSGFGGFPPEALAFFRGLTRNNDRDWFLAHKQTFERSVKTPMVEMIEALNVELAVSAPLYVSDPQRSIFRIYRDTRFSRDKTPYKTHIAAVFNRRGLERGESAGLYFSVSPEEIEVAGGLYMPGPEQLLAVRHHLVEHHQRFRRILKDRRLRALMGDLDGERLTRVPKGFPAPHPAEDLIRYKQWGLYTLLDPGLATSPKLIREVRRRFLAMVALVEFLNEPLKPRRTFVADETARPRNRKSR